MLQVSEPLFRPLHLPADDEPCCIPTVAYRGGVGGFNPPEILKALQNRAKLNPIVKTVKIAEFRTPTHQDVRKRGSKILKLPRHAIVLH